MERLVVKKQPMCIRASSCSAVRPLCSSVGEHEWLSSKAVETQGEVEGRVNGYQRRFIDLEKTE